MQVLTKERPETAEFLIRGRAAILITGQGSAQILRRLGEETDFHPITDAAGNEVEFVGTGGVMFNSDFENNFPQARFKIRVVTDTEVQVHVEVSA